MPAWKVVIRTPRSENADFESILATQPQKGRVARRGSSIRNAFESGLQSLRRVGAERIAESRDRVHALRERVPAGIPQPRPAGAGKPPPPGFPAGSALAGPASRSRGASRSSACSSWSPGSACSAIVSFFFGIMMAITQDLPQLEAKKEFAEAKNSGGGR